MEELLPLIIRKVKESKEKAQKKKQIIREQEIKEEKEREEQIQKERRYQELVDRIIIFPGTKELYEKEYSHEVIVIDTKRRNKGVRLTLITPDFNRNFQIENKNLRNYLVDEGIEAIINASRSSGYNDWESTSTITYYGLPVKKSSS